MQCADGVIAQTAIVALACFPCNGKTVKIPAVNYIMASVVTLNYMENGI